MTRDEAIDAARSAAEERGWAWAWIEPIDARRRRRFLAFGGREWAVQSRADCRGANVRVRLNDATGHILSIGLLPR